ncbi:hypothetical protein BDI4_210034 [Burkholderia diffusa]|uniref:hypothetical protein n=1 Tax=Burkholderia diffusa TaxID=488732 RepID=UPI001CAFF866|nr:hypothetical protein [Burkholderia diffusa]CAG9247721.1 hypothetical protein BDI4_210034 [Burkholderia diffusa]
MANPMGVIEYGDADELMIGQVCALEQLDAENPIAQVRPPPGFRMLLPRFLRSHRHGSGFQVL